MGTSRRQTLPTITLRYATDDMTGDLAWVVTVSDGNATSAPVRISPETAAGIAQIIDVALPLPVDVGGEPVSAEHVVRAAHVQTLAAQLAVAEADLRASAPQRSTTVPRAVTAVVEVPAPAPEAIVARPKARTRARSAAVAVVPAATDEAPDVDAPSADGPDIPLAPAVEPANYPDAPEYLPRAPHLSIPEIAEF